MDELIVALRKAAAEIHPHPMLGDDDSIHLTDYQEGIRQGLLIALQYAKIAKEQKWT